MFILKHCDREKLLYKWWANDTVKNFRAFLSLLSICISCVSYDRLLKESSFIVLNILEDFMGLMYNDLNDENSPLIEQFFDTLMILLRQKQTVSFLSSCFLTIKRFIIKFSQLIFGKESTYYSRELCYEILRYTDSVNAITRSEAGSLIYMMIKTNFQIRGNFSRTKLQSTIAISKLCGEAEGKEFQYLQKTLDYAAKLAKKEFKDNPLGNDVGNLVIRLFAVIKDSLNIAKYSYDPETIIDLTYQVSLGYKESPDLRLTWIENLITRHTIEKNYEEIAQCKFLIVALIVESLLITKSNSIHPGLPKSKEDLSFISPNVIEEPNHPTTESNNDENLFNSTLFSEKGLISTISSVAKFLKFSQRFETCIDMYNILLDYYQTIKDYENLTICFRDLKDVCSLLVTTDKQEGRLFNHFYRVCYYGKPFGQINGAEMIYKENAMVRVADFTERLKKQYSSLGTLVILPNTQAVDKSKLESDDIHVQITAVTPYFEDDPIERKTEWDNNFNVREFIFETPFTSTGKAHGDLSVQCKRKTIVKTEKSFPYVKKRLKVISKREVILQPLQNAIEIIQTREKALRMELHRSPANPKTLQIQLQGAVLAR